MKILFINGSPNKEGNTKKLADAIHETLPQSLQMHYYQEKSMKQ